jgi:hypothetical protein
MAMKNMMSRHCEGCCFVDLPRGEVRKMCEIPSDIDKPKKKKKKKRAEP